MGGGAVGEESKGGKGKGKGERRRGEEAGGDGGQRLATSGRLAGRESVAAAVRLDSRSRCWSWCKSRESVVSVVVWLVMGLVPVRGSGGRRSPDFGWGMIEGTRVDFE
ncbi:hypothetical protein Droror1_Dr00016635 [Drosera rotundifolia]